MNKNFYPIISDYGKQNSGKLNLKLNIKVLCLAVLIGCFFEPLILIYMQRDGFHPMLAKWISNAYDATKIIVSLFAFLYISLNKSIFNRTLTIEISIILYSVSMLIACLINGSLSISQIATVYQQLGLILFIYYNYQLHPKRTHAAGVFFFGLMSFLSVLNVVLLPEGIYTSSEYYTSKSIYSSIFVFGGKNASFPYYFCYLFSWISYHLKWNKKTVNAIPVLLLFMYSAIRCQSTNTMICLGLILIINCIMVMSPGVFKHLNPINIYIPLCIVIFSVYFGVTTNTFNIILQLLGRDTSFSGRNIIWMQALHFFTQSPIFGMGSNIYYSTIFGNVSHAHSQYLDILAKYGLLSFALFIYTIILYVKSISIEKDWKLRNFLLSMSAIYMLHMTFDTYSLNYFLYIITIGVLVVITNCHSGSK